MKALAFLKELLWDEEINNLTNFFFLLSTGFISFIFYQNHFHNALPETNFSVFEFQNINILKLLLSLAVILLFQGLCLSIFSFIGRISKNAIKKDIQRNFPDSSNDLKSVLTDADKEEAGRRLQNMRDKVASYVTHNKDDFSAGITYVISPKGVRFINKVMIMFLTISYFLAYIWIGRAGFIACSVILSILTIVFNIALSLAIEYRSLLTEVSFIKETIYNDGQKTIG
jgi:hypothetical protein